MIVPASFPPSRVAPPLSHDDPRGWRGRQGESYAERNPDTVEKLNASYMTRFGVSRTDLALHQLADVPRSARVLEIGCSHGVQLEVLRRLGFTNLFGVDLNRPAVEKCRSPCAVADGIALPFRDDAFDLVLTSGTLMHVPPEERAAFCRETSRVCTRWVWGFELWAPELVIWTFNGLIPKAWSLPEPESYGRIGRWILHHERRFESDKMNYSMYLLEKA